jgi:hypothetical protein
MSLRFKAANMDFVRGHDRAYLAHLCEGADVLLVQEAKDVTLADVLPDGWVALQDTTSPATMGSAIAYRRETVWAGSDPLHLVEGSSPFWLGRRVGMLTRYIATAHLQERATGEWRFAVAAHMPPLRFKFLQPGMTRRLRKVLKGHPHAVVGIDANQPLTRLADRLHMRSYGKGIVGLLFGSGLQVSGGAIDHYGERHGYTDHPSVSAVTHKRKVAS